jgi:hypothetical protein
MKIWRALWRVSGSMKYCDKDKDPSLGIRRKTPIARSDIWHEGEAVRLVKQAWRSGYRGLAAEMAVSWDTLLSPVDVRAQTARSARRILKARSFFRTGPRPVALRPARSVAAPSTCSMLI